MDDSYFTHEFCSCREKPHISRFTISLLTAILFGMIIRYQLPLDVQIAGYFSGMLGLLSYVLAIYREPPRPAWLPREPLILK